MDYTRYNNLPHSLTRRRSNDLFCQQPTYQETASSTLHQAEISSSQSYEVIAYWHSKPNSPWLTLSITVVLEQPALCACCCESPLRQSGLDFSSREDDNRNLTCILHLYVLFLDKILTEKMKITPDERHK
jgi:hypothetical protein